MGGSSLALFLLSLCIRELSSGSYHDLELDYKSATLPLFVFHMGSFFSFSCLYVGLGWGGGLFSSFPSLHLQHQGLPETHFFCPARGKLHGYTYLVTPPAGSKEKSTPFDYCGVWFSAVSAPHLLSLPLSGSGRDHQGSQLELSTLAPQTHHF